MEKWKLTIQYSMYLCFLVFGDQPISKNVFKKNKWSIHSTIGKYNSELNKLDNFPDT